MSNSMYRHGDLLLESVNEIPEGSIKRETNVILGGTATGHAHKLVNGIIFDKEGTTYLQAQNEARIVHDEHNTIELPVGNYVVIRQREFDPYAQAVRNVMD